MLGSKVSKLLSSLRIGMTSDAPRRPFIILVSVGRKTLQDASHQAGWGTTSPAVSTWLWPGCLSPPGNLFPGSTQTPPLTSRPSRATASNAATH